jgi:putative phosphoribosyl transferase
MRFKDRTDAGQKLAEKLIGYKADKPLILALPRGGVPVGFEIAKALSAPLDTIIARKIGSPSNPEFGIGAIAPDDVSVFNSDIVKSLRIEKRSIDRVIELEKQEMDRRIKRYKSGKWSKGASKDIIIVVDDGLATGLSACAALESVRKVYRPKKLIFASPICASDSLESLEPYADEIICVSESENLVAIGEWYENFPQASDEEVLYYLNKAYEQKKGTHR